MRVHNFRTREIDGRKRVSADVLWETAERPTEEIFYEVDREFSNDILCNPNAFFLSTLLPAFYYGEKRYAIESEICPVLYQGAKDALGYFKLWYSKGEKPKAFNLEVKTRNEVQLKGDDRNSACFFTGGIDSYATLFDNWNTYPKEHPGHITDGIIAYGLDLDDPEKFEYVLSFLKQTVRELDLNLIPVYTNIYLKYREEDKSKDFYFWKYEYQGAALASIAHILSERIKMISIAASFDLHTLSPYGSHPLIDSNYSSANLKVHHDGVLYSRFDKTKIVVQNYETPNNLRVCNRYRRFEPENLNCGRCEKCIRTMLEFLVLDKLRSTDVFPFDDVTGEMVVKNAIIDMDYVAYCYEELIEPLKEINRLDLAEAVESVLKRYHRQDSTYYSILRNFDRIINHKDNMFLSALKKIDKNILNGSFRKILNKLKFRHGINEK